jgi:hypothetical protein
METTLPSKVLIDAVDESARKDGPFGASPGHRRPSVKSVLAEAGALPHEALFLGLAADGLPVLLNLYDPVPGPLLIVGDPSSGKTALLQTIAYASDLMHTPAEVQFCTVTPSPHAWDRFQGSRSNAGIYGIRERQTSELLDSLVTWAHHNKGERQSILLIIDGLAGISQIDPQAEQNLRWLLLRGPSRRVWPILTLHAEEAVKMHDWMAYFRTRLFGRTRDDAQARNICGRTENPLSKLAPGSQFAMRDGETWLTFICPSMD